MAANLEEKPSLIWKLTSVFVLFGAAIIFFWDLGSRSVVSEEMRWAEIAREMQSSGDYFRPTINHQPYIDKPVGSYWLILCASSFTGHVDEFSARVPAALAGLIGVAITLWLNRKINGETASIWSGAILATSFGYAFYSRRATADVETVVGVLAAVAWFYRNQNQQSKWWVVPLWLGMAAVSLTKGLLGFVLPCLIFTAYGIVNAWMETPSPFRFRNFIRSAVSFNGWFWNYWTLLALPLAATVYFLPFAMAHDAMSGGLEMVWRENIKRFVSPHNHTGPVYLYLGVIFILAAPWSLFLPAALIHAKETFKDNGNRLVTIYFGIMFAFFTASASRRSYYLLPILPPAAMLIGRLLSMNGNELKPITQKLRSVAWCLLSLAVVCLGIGLIPPSWVLPEPYRQLPPLPGRIWLAGIWIFGILTVAWAWIYRRQPHRFVVLAGVIAFFAYAFGVAYRLADEERPRRLFLDAVRTQSENEPEHLALFHCSDIVFDLGRTCAAYEVPEYLNQAIHEHKVKWIVLPHRQWESIHLNAKIIAEENAMAWESKDRHANKLMLLELVQ